MNDLFELITPSNEKILLRWVRQKNRKRLCLTFGRDGMPEVRTPIRTSAKEAITFTQQHLNWLQKHLPAKHKEAEGLVFEEGAKVMRWGKPYWLRLHLTEEEPKVWFTEDEVHVSSPTIESARALLYKRIVEEVLHFIKTRGEEIVEEFQEMYQVSPKRITLKNMKSKWGRCNQRGDIALNVRLGSYAPHYLEYTLKHELCHLLEMNHSSKFYSHLERILPERKRIEKELAKNRINILPYEVLSREM